MVSYFDSFDEWYKSTDTIKRGISVVRAYGEDDCWEVRINNFKLLAVFYYGKEDAILFAEAKSKRLGEDNG